MRQTPKLTHGGKRRGAGRKASVGATRQIRVSATTAIAVTLRAAATGRTIAQVIDARDW